MDRIEKELKRSNWTESYLVRKDLELSKMYVDAKLDQAKGETSFHLCYLDFYHW